MEPIGDQRLISVVNLAASRSAIGRPMKTPLTLPLAVSTNMVAGIRNVGTDIIALAVPSASASQTEPHTQSWSHMSRSASPPLASHSTKGLTVSATHTASLATPRTTRCAGNRRARPVRHPVEIRYVLQLAAQLLRQLSQPHSKMQR